MANLNVVFAPPFENNFDFPSKTPMFSTIVKRPQSNRGEIRASLNPYPLWKIQYDMNWARGGEQDANTVFQYVLGFFLQMGGQFSSFLYHDPNDNEVENSYLATGDGLTTLFQLQRSIGFGFDIVQNLNGTPTIYSPGYDYPTGENPTAVMNYARWSQDQTQATWSKGNCTVTGPVHAPDGGFSADTIVPNSGSTDSYIAEDVTPPDMQPGNQYVFKIWLRATSSAQNVNLFFLGNSGAITATTVNVGTSWDFYTLTVTVPVGVTTLAIQIGGAGSITDAQNIEVAWAQVEPGITPHAYVVTGATPFYYTISPTGIVQFSYAPSFGNVLTWTGKYYYRVRFGDDETTFDQEFERIWENKQLLLQSVIL